ncbi:long-chain-fatty-acid--CoA ligase [Microvirga roseola]|uniref:long-chain-fatty-acid--CoA ligase n=1 Tax=Microvirga roseola TaxID=2883126 RepID=UPI002AC31EE9|nr:long-chain-fatty-acid--CoA ligase [Microvirga roseola]
MLKGMMLDRPLSIPAIIDYAAEVHPNAEIVSVTVEGGIHRTNYKDIRKRIASLAHGLLALGVKPSDRVATLAWNGYRHFELYYAISGIGAVCHTINPRLFPEQLAYIVNHAQDSLLFFDITFAPLVTGLRPKLPSNLKYVAMTGRETMPAQDGLDGLLCYEDLLAGQPDTIVWPELDENTAAALSYTSGTTGEPKGVLYSHRSNVLHATSGVIGSPRAFGSDRKILPVVPLFHVNAWGLPYSAPLSGTSLVFPGPKLDGASLFDLMDREKVHNSWGVPTVWLGLLNEMKLRGRKPEGLAQVLIGGSAAPQPMIETFERDFGVEVCHGWGMTEMSPIGTLGTLTPEMEQLSFEERIALKVRQGRRLFMVEMKIVDENGKELPKDGEAFGELCVRGPSVASGYYNNEAATAQALDAEGWFRTGDVAKITPDGFLQIVDRTKDLVKSGGEWISSIDLENAALGCPGVAHCAVLAMPHPRWGERPLLVVVPKPDAKPAKEDILTYLSTKVASWQVPDDVLFVESIPLTATAKISKLELRKLLKDYVLPTAA